MLICDSKLQEALSLPPPSPPPSPTFGRSRTVGGVLPCQGVKFLSNLKTKSPRNGGESVLPGVLFLSRIIIFISYIMKNSSRLLCRC